MVAESQRHRLDSFEFKARSSFSHHDLDYKMKMLQLTLVYRRSVADDRPAPIAQPNRHSFAQETFGKAKQMAIHQPFHLPKILAVEPKQRQSAKTEKKNKSMADVTSATLPTNPQSSKVQRLVRMFESNTNTAPKRVPSFLSSKRVVEPKTKPKMPEAEKKPQDVVTEVPVDSIPEPVPNDNQIRAELSQRRKLDAL
ncbi:uncharacterized protein LOC110674481 isoform X2 [Aedes aegypti]|uniref:Uncharacterized protein n=1 Tax=Aedes aegypti TaxID=7159 RepID=A0A6I8U6V4_AEDAE|nr:uncharacterized protein LOC110674481 isoform X2 [Aedes aegypti]